MPDGARSIARQARRWLAPRRISIDRADAVRLTRPGMRLDLGGIAKGYILQQALSAMASRGVTRALVEAGGDIVVGDAPPESRRLAHRRGSAPMPRLRRAPRG